MPNIQLLKRKRPNATGNKRWYQYVYADKRWKRLRKCKFANNPICEECAKKNPMVVRVTKEIHHIIPIEMASKNEDMIAKLAFDYDNTISLCVECHKAAHIKINTNTL